ncbi:uncharacterized protein LOC114975128 isoform X2 [Acropora millepora]|nr:uncharacterized protein LOC114975128 isoform X2 [Acropora millepora]XP_044178934.1 uncharacterized protein LOC114975128 isoform X2 [Acropora millepora]
MAHESTKNTKYKVDISNSFINTLVIGDGNIIRNILPSQQKIAANQNGESRGKKRQKQSKIRFPQRKFGRESRTVVKEDNECVNVNLPLRVPPNSSDAVEKGIFTILNLLHPLRDSGKWQEFNNVAENLRLKNQENLTFNILITLEQSVVESYHNKIEKAEEMVKAALQILEKSKGQAIDATSYLYLITMAHIHLTGFYRRQNKHGKAEEAINIGYQNSTGLTSHFLKALVFYEKASNSTKYISSIPNGPARNEHFASAKDLMKQCITGSTDLDNNGGIYIRKHHFCFLKLALMALNCRTQAARGQIPSAECIEDATNCLKEVDEKYAAQISEGQQIQFLIAKGDLSFRQQNYQVAQGNYKQALALAEKCGFKLEISGIEDRLADIATLIDKKESMDLEIHLSEEGHPDSLSSSTSPSKKNSPYSTSSEMDIE